MAHWIRYLSAERGKSKEQEHKLCSVLVCTPNPSLKGTRGYALVFSPYSVRPRPLARALGSSLAKASAFGLLSPASVIAPRLPLLSGSPTRRSRGRGVTLWPVSPSLVRPRPLARALGSSRLLDFRKLNKKLGKPNETSTKKNTLCSFIDY